MGKFKGFFEGTDIFGFDSKPDADPEFNPLDNQPMRVFNLEYLMDILKHKKINSFEATEKFINEIQWGNRFGSIKLEVDTGFTFFIKRLGYDLEGHPRWISKRAFQLNRKGLGGYEEYVAEELVDSLKECISEVQEAPQKDFKQLDRLTEKIGTTMRKVAQAKFLFQRIKKLSENQYQIIFEVGSQGVEARDHKRIEENVTEVSYDPKAGTIRVTNYNIVSKVGAREWKVNQSDLDLYFFPSQDFGEICECIAVHFKYY